MAKDDPQSTAERLFAAFLAPLVLGGAMSPGHPFGGKQALSMGDERPPTDVDRLSRCELARVRIARKLAPIDTLSPAPTGNEWALAAVLHDLVQATHPDFEGMFRRSGPRRLLDVAERTLEHVPSPDTVGDALSRHTWFSRMFELARTDIDVQWWSGSRRFLGNDPPKHLTAWPELRRVTETRTLRPLMSLPESSSVVDQARFAAVVTMFLGKTPLTDLATVTRPTPTFAWSRESLALAATHGGRTIVHRAHALLSPGEVDAALGHATKELFAARATRALLVAIDLLRERALVAASTRLHNAEPELTTALPEQDDAAFAIGVGAMAATNWLSTTGGGLSDHDRRSMLERLQPAAHSPAAKEAKAYLG